MHFVPGITVRDLPPPRTTDEVVEQFGAPVFTFVSQAAIEEAGCGTVVMNDVLVDVSLGYCFYRHPADREDPANFRDDVDSTMSAIRKAESDSQPDWFITTLRQMRYPMMWEAVRTVRLGVDVDRPLAQRLAEHVNHILINTIDGRRLQGEDEPPTLDHGVTAAHAQSGFSLNVDGADVDALKIDTDPNIVGWAAMVDDCAVLVAIDRDLLPMIDLALERRRPSHSHSGQK